MADDKLDVIPSPATPPLLGDRVSFGGQKSASPTKILGQDRAALATSCPGYVSVFDLPPDSNGTITQ